VTKNYWIIPIFCLLVFAGNIFRFQVGFGNAVCICLHLRFTNWEAISNGSSLKIAMPVVYAVYKKPEVKNCRHSGRNTYKYFYFCIHIWYQWLNTDHWMDFKPLSSKRKLNVKINIVFSKTTLYLPSSFHRVRIKNGPGFLPRPTLFLAIAAKDFNLVSCI